MKSLHTQHHPLSSTTKQLEILDDELQNGIMPFRDNLASGGLYPLKPTGIEIFQINVGKQCNQTCKHCHVDAGPDRKEKMSREIMDACLQSPSLPLLKELKFFEHLSLLVFKKLTQN